MKSKKYLRGRAAVAAAVVATSIAVPLARGAVQTYSTVAFAPNTGADHPGFGFHQADFAWDDGIAGEFEFSGSDGAFTMAAYAFGGGGTTGRAADHAAFFQMDYNPAPPARSFGTFWFGGIGNDIGPLPSTTYGSVLAFADVIAPAGKPYTFRIESNFTTQGNGFSFQGVGNGTWQTVGGQLSAATPIGGFNTADPTLAALVAFGPNEIAAVDDGTDPLNVPTLMIDNLTLTPAASNWSATGGGNWSDGANWPTLAGVAAGVAANGANATATFGNSILATSTVTVDGPMFAGHLQINSGQSYTFAGAGSASVNIRTVGAGTNGIVTVGDLGSHTISAPLEIWNNTTVNVLLAGSSLNVSNLLDAHDGVTLTKAGAGTFSVPNVRAAGLIVTGGTVHVHANGGNAGTSKVGTLSISGGASLDVHDNDLVVVGGNSAAIGALVAQARNAGQWNAPGLTSTAARTSPQANTGLGVLTGAEYNTFGNGNGTFSGQSYAPGDVLVKYTWNGDTNFSGTVNFDDYVRVDVGFNTNLTGWGNGDFNYSGGVNFDDYVMIDVAFNTQSGTLGRAIQYVTGEDRSSNGLDGDAVGMVVQHLGQFGAPYASAFLAAVPEPAAGIATTLLAFGLTTTSARRRRRSRS